MATVYPASTPDAITQAVAILRRGGLVAFPTETVYGLGANALDAAAVRKVFAAKGRPATNPVIVHIADASQVSQVAAEFPPIARKLADRFWPGPLTLVLPKQRNIPDEVTAGGPTVAVRVPAHPVALALLREVGIPLAAPSANRSTQLSPTTALHVANGLADRVDMILDGGACPGGIESTVLDVTTSPPTLLRPGLISRGELESLIGPIQSAIHAAGPARSPGMQELHYAPRTPLELVEGDGAIRVRELVTQSQSVGWLTWPQALDVAGAERRNMDGDWKNYASSLYSLLHELDALRLNRIVVANPPDTPEWTAVRDRLMRAASDASATRR